MDVGAVDYQGAPLGHHLLQLVHYLACGPKLVIELRGAAQGHLVGPLLQHHVHPGGEIRCLAPALLQVPDKKPAEALVLPHHHGHALHLHGHHGSGPVYEFPNRGMLHPYDFPAGYDRPQPVEKMEEFPA